MERNLSRYSERSSRSEILNGFVNKSWLFLCQTVFFFVSSLIAVLDPPAGYPLSRVSHHFPWLWSILPSLFSDGLNFLLYRLPGFHVQFEKHSRQADHRAIVDVLIPQITEERVLRRTVELMIDVSVPLDVEEIVQGVQNTSLECTSERVFTDCRCASASDRRAGEVDECNGRLSSNRGCACFHRY